MSDVRATIVAILRRHAEAPVLEAPADRIELSSLGIDSAEMINVIIAIEDAFDLDVEDEYVHRLRTVADIVSAVREHLEPSEGRRIA
jgi:acyl carrier protein